MDCPFIYDIKKKKVIQCTECPFHNTEDKRCEWARIKEIMAKDKNGISIHLKTYEEAYQRMFNEIRTKDNENQFRTINEHEHEYTTPELMEMICQCRCPECNAPHHTIDLRMFNASNASKGVKVSKFSGRQIIWANCDSCGMRTSFQEILRQLGRNN